MIPRGKAGENGWRFGIDGDAYHPDWEHNIDGDYVPKGRSYTYDFDRVLPRNASTSHLNIDPETGLLRKS